MEDEVLAAIAPLSDIPLTRGTKYLIDACKHKKSNGMNKEKADTTDKQQSDINELVEKFCKAYKGFQNTATRYLEMLNIQEADGVSHFRKFLIENMKQCYDDYNTYKTTWQKP